MNAEEKGSPNVVDRVAATFNQKGHGKLAKWKVAAALRDKVLADPASVPESTLDQEGAELDAVKPIRSPPWADGRRGPGAIDELLLLAVREAGSVDSRRATVERFPVSSIHRPNSAMSDRRTLNRLRLAWWHHAVNRRKSVA